MMRREVLDLKKSFVYKSIHTPSTHYFSKIAQAQSYQQMYSEQLLSCDIDLHLGLDLTIIKHKYGLMKNLETISRFSFIIFLDLAPFSFLSTLISLPVIAEGKQLPSMMLPTSCVAMEMVCSRWCVPDDL